MACEGTYIGVHMLAARNTRPWLTQGGFSNGENTRLYTMAQIMIRAPLHKFAPVREQ